MKKIVLGIETSCDETSVSVVEGQKGKVKILSNIVSSQVDIHRKYGGIVPEVASRAHVEEINFITKEALKKAGKKINEISFFAVTCGPGLSGSLAIGAAFGKTLSIITEKKLLCINHLEGHIYANFVSEIKNQKSKIKKIEFPAIVLIVSGGHTQIVLMKNNLSYKVLGDTKDDAAGEVFDKVARILNIGYPGGPIIEKLAKKGNKNAYKFPRFGLDSITTRNKEGFLIKNPPDLDFSFSGLKTAVLYKVKKDKDINKADAAASFQKAVIEVLVKKTIWAACRNKVASVLLSGGVSANKELQKELRKEAKKNNFNFYCPKTNLSTDNAAMIATAGYFRYQERKFNKQISVNPNLKIS